MDTENANRTQGTQTDMKTKSQLCQTDLTMELMEKQDNYVHYLTDELTKLKQQVLDTQLNENSFRGNDEKTKFYTGISNFLLLINVFNFVAPHVKNTVKNSLTQFQEFLFVLIRLKLNVP